MEGDFPIFAGNLVAGWGNESLARSDSNLMRRLRKLL